MPGVSCLAEFCARFVHWHFEIFDIFTRRRNCFYRHAYQRSRTLFVQFYDRQKPYGTIAAADREKAFSNVKWLFRRKLCASHSTGITGLFRTFSQLLHYHVLTDAAGNELLCLCDDHRKTVPLSVEDKTAYEAGNNHEHLLDDISDEVFSELVADAPVLCRLIYCNIKMQYPRRKLAVYAAVSRHDSLTVRFHQVWTGEPPYYDPEDFSSGDERVFSVID